MRLLFHAPETVSLDGDAAGVRREILSRKAMAEESGCHVDLFDPWSRVKIESYDIVHTFSPTAGRLLFYETVLRRARRLVVSPILDKTYPAFVLRTCALLTARIPRLFSHLGDIRRLVRHADGVFARSDDEAGLVASVFGVTPARIHLVPNAVDLTRAPKSRCDRPASSTTENAVLFVGDISNPRKNVIRLIQAVGPTGLELRLIGPRRSPQELHHVMKAARTFPNVHLLGEVDRETLWTEYSRATVFALPSLMEGTGLAALEAAYAGATVVITNRGGTASYFGSNAIYVDPYSVRSIRHGIMEAITRPRSNQLQARIEDLFSPAQVARVQHAAYERVLADERTPRVAPYF